MFWFLTRKKQKEAEQMADRFKERISELQLLILSGEMRDKDLDHAKRALEILKGRLNSKVKGETERLVEKRASLRG